MERILVQLKRNLITLLVVGDLVIKEPGLGLEEDALDNEAIPVEEVEEGEEEEKGEKMVPEKSSRFDPSKVMEQDKKKL